MRILYLSYTGLLEPLGQSQVLAYLRLLAREHAIRLVTFEKGADLRDPVALGAMRAVCQAAGIEWRPLRYHHRPRLLATAWDLAVLLAVLLASAVRFRPALVHCRSYVPAFAAAALRVCGGPRYVFDTRALWLEEMIAAGRLERGSRLHRLLRRSERFALARASAVVSLTEAALPRLRALAGAAPDDGRFVMVPTCVDLHRFPLRAVAPAGRPVVGCLGTVLSGWFRLDWLHAFLTAVADAAPGAEVRIVSRDDPAAIRAALGPALAGRVELSVTGVGPAEVPAALEGVSLSPFFFDRTEAKLASSPTRLGELLALGIPVVANTGTGDVDTILTRYDVGVLVPKADAGAMRAAFGRAVALAADPAHAARCRAAAEDWFSLDRGVARYGALYRAAAAR